MKGINNPPKINDMDELFRLVNNIMNSHFSGAYKRLGNPSNYQDESEDDDSIDITQDSKYIYITLELTGIEEENLNVFVEPYQLVLEIFLNGEWGQQTINLPCKVKKKAKISYNNYILDVILTKDKRSKNGKNK